MAQLRRTGTRPDGRAVPGDLAPDVTAEVVVVRLDGTEASPRTQARWASARTSRRLGFLASPRPRTERSPSPTGASGACR